MSSPERLMPHDVKAEDACLGACLRVNSRLDDVSLLIHDPEFFYADIRQKIYRIMLDLRAKGKEFDIVTIANVLKDRSQVEDLGGYGYLGELWDAAPVVGNATYYAEIVREKALLRRMIRAGENIAQMGWDQSEAVEGLLARAEQSILEIAQMGVTGDAATAKEVFEEAYAELARRVEVKRSGIGMIGIPSGYRDLDELTGGFRDSEVTVIAARPGVGKTAFALNLATNFLVRDIGVFAVSAEMSKRELGERILAAQSNVDALKMRKGELSNSELNAVCDSKNHWVLSNFHVDDRPDQTMMRVRANARRIRRKHGIKVVMIDYLQLIKPESRKDNREQQVAEISRNVKFMAKELQIPVLLLAQLNREVEKRGAGKPKLSDLRESGAIEQDADTVMFLKTPDANDDGTEKQLLEVIVEKNRNGPLGDITLSFEKRFSRIIDLPTGYPS